MAENSGFRIIVLKLIKNQTVMYRVIENRSLWFGETSAGDYLIPFVCNNSWHGTTGFSSYDF